MLKGLQKIDGNTFMDNRGIIHEVFKDFLIKSVTHTHSVKDTLRGIHIQDFNRIVYIVYGQVLAGFYDPRTKEKLQVPMHEGEAYFVPKGIGNSYLALTDVDYLYFNTENYDGTKLYTVSYKVFDWPITNPIVSKKDKEAKW